MMRLAVTLGLVAASLLPGPLTAAPSGETGSSDPTGCPGHHCRNYLIDCPGPAERERRDCRRGTSLFWFNYWINPVNAHGIEPEELRSWIMYATRTWEYANPRIRFRFLGFTERPPIGYDGFNTIGFATADAGGAVVSMGGPGEWDMWLNIWHTPFWAPCRFECGPVPREKSLINHLDIASILVHEFGHVIGLQHPVPIDGIEPRCTTMYVNYCDPTASSRGLDERFMQSPSLAELLALREKYPYTCPKPPPRVKNASEDRGWLPWRYQRVCPTLLVAVP